MDKWLGKMATALGISGDDSDDEPPKAEPALSKLDEKVDYGKIAAKLFEKGKLDENDVDPNDVKQGRLGDCAFLAAVAAVARAKPDALKKLIKKNGDGTYDVTLYVHDKWFSVDRKPKVIKKIKPTYPLDKDGNPVYAQMPDEKETWVLLLEKAYAIHTGSFKELNEGVFPEDAIEALGGKDADSHKLSSLSADEIKKMIASALKEKRPITAWTGKIAEKKMEVVLKKYGTVIAQHAYSIQALSGDKVKLDNPHGRNDIELPISVFKVVFYRIDVAQA